VPRDAGCKQPAPHGVIIPLGSPSPATSNDLPGSSGDAGRVVLPYLVFLRVGLA